MADGRDDSLATLRPEAIQCLRQILTTQSGEVALRAAMLVLGFDEQGRSKSGFATQQFSSGSPGFTG
jgi:hypothetical protein